MWTREDDLEWVERLGRSIYLTGDQALKMLPRDHALARELASYGPRKTTIVEIRPDGTIISAGGSFVDWSLIALKKAVNGDYGGAKAAMDNAHRWGLSKGLDQHPAFVDIRRILSAIIANRGAIRGRGMPPRLISSWDPYLRRRVMRSQPKPLGSPSSYSIKAMERLLAEITKTDPSSYVKSRQDDLKVVEADMKAGRLEIAKAPELSAQALAERSSLLVHRARVEKEENELKEKLKKAKKRASDVEKSHGRMRAELEKVRGELRKIQELPEPDYGLAGRFRIKRPRTPSWARRPFRQIRRSWKDLTDEAKRALDPVRHARDELASTFLPRAVRRFGRQIEAETRRLGRRIDKEMIRGLKNVAKYGDWIRAFSVVLRWAIPFGVIFQLVVIAFVAAAEITYAQRQKKELDDRLKKLMELVSAEIARLDEQARKMAEETEKMRLLIAKEREAAAAERERRLGVAREVMVTLESERAKNTAVAAGGGILAGFGALNVIDGNVVSGLAIAGVGTAGAILAYRRAKKASEQLESYYSCRDEGGTEQECRASWALARAGFGA